MAEVRQDREVLEAAGASYDALARRLERARAVGLLGANTVPQAAFQFHAACQGLATNELLHEPPPIGSSFWVQTLDDFDGPALWHGALTALVAGMSASLPQRPQ